MRLWVKCFVVAVTLSTLLTSTQSRADLPPVGETIEVSIVNVDVVVTDKSGKHVRGLTQRDFEILQDGKPQPITNFAEYGTATGDATVSVSTPDAPRAAAAVPPQKRTLVVFVDRFSLKPWERDTLFAQVKETLHEVVRPGDAVMIVSWRSHVVTRLPFTDDHDAIDRTLDHLHDESSYVLPDRMADVENEREWLQEVSQNAASKGYTIDVADEVPLSGVEAATRARFEMKRKVRALNGIMSSMSGIEGKKVLMLLTNRFSRIAGQEYLIGLEAAPHSRTSREIEFDMQTEIDSVAKTANANGVTVYLFYPAGLGSDTMPNAARSGSQRISPTGSRDYIVLANELEAMNNVAAATGGVIAWGAKNIANILPSVEDDFDSYYSLAYKSTGSGEQRAHRVSVRLKNRNLKVRSRHEFVEKSDETKMKDRVLASLIHNPEPSPLEFEVSLGTVTQKGKHQYRVPVEVRVPMHSLMTLPQVGEQAGGFSVYVGWGGVLGEMSEVKRETRSFTIERGEEEKAASSYITYEFELLLDEKTDRLVIGIVDEVSHDYGIRRLDLPPRSEMIAAK